MNDSLDYSAVTKLFHQEFILAYADVVTVLLQKPEQILTEIENVFFHLMQTTNSNIGITDQQDNLKKAYSHLVRATLDCNKLLWLKFSTDINKLHGNYHKRLFSLNLNKDEFLDLYKRFNRKGRQARLEELKRIGADPLESMQLYRQANSIGWEIVKNIDSEKSLAYDKFRFWVKIKDHSVALATGIVSGIIATLLVQYFF